MAQRLQFTYDIFRGMCSLNNTELWLLFRSIWELIYKWKNPILSDKLKWMYYIIKPYIEDDTERHVNYIKWKKSWGIASWKSRASIIIKKSKRSFWTEWTEWTEWTSDIDIDIDYNKDIVLSRIKIEKFRIDFPKKNIEIEFNKFWRWWEWEWKKIKKPNQAFWNWLSPKTYDKEYIDWITEKDDSQWIKEFLFWKMKFHDKYWWDKYQKVKDLRIKQCLAQPLSL